LQAGLKRELPMITNAGRRSEAGSPPQGWRIRSELAFHSQRAVEHGRRGQRSTGTPDESNGERQKRERLARCHGCLRRPRDPEPAV